MSRDVVGEKVLNTAPNKDERFDSVLPLIPGVVRGPDGLISMEGTRASQGGSLLNGANVPRLARGRICTKCDDPGYFEIGTRLRSLLRGLPPRRDWLENQQHRRPQ